MSQPRIKVTLFPKRENVPCIFLETLVPTYQITGCHCPEQKSLYPGEGSIEVQRNTLVHNIHFLFYITLLPTRLRLRSSHHQGERYKRTYIHTYIVKQFFYEFRRCGSVRFTLHICSLVFASLMMVRSAPKPTGVNTT